MKGTGTEMFLDVGTLKVSLNLLSYCPMVGATGGGEDWENGGWRRGGWEGGGVGGGVGGRLEREGLKGGDNWYERVIGRGVVGVSERDDGGWGSGRNK